MVKDYLPYNYLLGDVVEKLEGIKKDAQTHSVASDSLVQDLCDVIVQLCDKVEQMRESNTLSCGG